MKDQTHHAMYENENGRAVWFDDEQRWHVWRYYSPSTVIGGQANLIWSGHTFDTREAAIESLLTKGD